VIRIFLITCFIIGVAFSQTRPKAPNFRLKSSTGKTIELAKLRGKVVVVNFWATWCAPCRAEIPGFMEVYRSYKSKGLEIIGISLDETGWEVVKPFLEKHKITYPVVVGDRKVVYDYGGIDAIPTTFVVNRDGDVVSGHRGLLPKAQLEKILREVL
jgi:cytochrome c biogenesis protein CcmG/thiol:disulfide interchange protein DsbE